MLGIDDRIRAVDKVICRYLDNMEDSTRGAISQDILSQLEKLVNLVMFRFYAGGKEPVYNEASLSSTRSRQRRSGTSSSVSWKGRPLIPSQRN